MYRSTLLHVLNFRYKNGIFCPLSAATAAEVVTTITAYMTAFGNDTERIVTTTSCYIPHSKCHFICLVHCSLTKRNIFLHMKRQKISNNKIEEKEQTNISK